MIRYEKTFDLDFIATASGRGYWGMQGGKEVNFKKIEIIIYDYDDDDNVSFGEVRAYHNAVNDVDGLCYTDKGVEDAIDFEVKVLLGNIVKGIISGSEQGMQGENYWSGDVQFIDTVTPDLLIEKGFTSQKE